jgi:hypothetical protein
LEDFGVKVPDSIPMHCDNKAATFIANHLVFHERTKHIEVDCYFIREAILANPISTPDISTEDQLADVFTKALPKKRLHSICTKLEGHWRLKQWDE